MLSHNLDFQKYENLQKKIKNFQEYLVDFQENNQNIELAFISLKNIIEHDILNLDQENIEVIIVSQWQSIQTEIYRTYRLLKTDILFLKSAKKANLIKKRLHNIKERLTQLNSYCNSILSLKKIIEN